MKQPVVAATFTRGGRTDHVVAVDWTARGDEIVASLEFIERPDLELLHELCGGHLLRDEHGEASGWAEPQQPRPDPVGVELWSAVIERGAILGYRRTTLTDAVVDGVVTDPTMVDLIVDPERVTVTRERELPAPENPTAPPPAGRIVGGDTEEA